MSDTKNHCRLHNRNVIIDPHDECSIVRKVPGVLGKMRRLFRNVNLSDQYDGHDQREPADIENAQVVSSQLLWRGEPTGMHAPVLDIDFPAVLVPSSTDGHFHLYLDKQMSWSVYKDLLEALARAGIIEHGYASASIDREHTAVRLPWVKKGES